MAPDAYPKDPEHSLPDRLKRSTYAKEQTARGRAAAEQACDPVPPWGMAYDKARMERGQRWP